MRIELLGPLRILHREQELVPPLAKQRAILGLLASRVNEPVPIEHIVRAVWETPPVSASERVHTYALGLRRMLGVGGTGSGGSDSQVSRLEDSYLLVLNPEAVDTRQFVRRCAQARRLRDDGRVDDAVRSFQAALGLWRGDAFANVSGPFARAERRRLEELRLSAVEQWCAIMLHAGRATETIALLSDLVSRDVFSQPLRRLLMLALYRAGRRAAALAFFQQTRRLLHDELGIEPQADLVELYRRVLADVSGRSAYLVTV